MNISPPAATVPGDTPACTMAKHPHLHSYTSLYALWVFGWPATSALAVIHGCYNPRDFTWAVSTRSGQLLYLIHGTPAEVFKKDPLMFAWLCGVVLDKELNDITARYIRKASIRLAYAKA